jgi:hypothetical protein
MTGVIEPKYIKAEDVALLRNIKECVENVVEKLKGIEGEF